MLSEARAFHTACLILWGLLVAASPTSAQVNAPGTEPFSVVAHVARAREIAGPDAASFGVDLLCLPTSGFLEGYRALRNSSGSDRVYVGRAFENIYYIGFAGVGTWLITTSDGLILIDALNTPSEAETILVPSIRSLGLNPADLRYVVVTHGHGDHFGGARYLQDTFGSRVVLAGPDWELTEGRSPEARARLVAPARDVVAEDGQEITVGETTVRILHTPGHTAGTISMIIPGRWGGETHYLTLAGGSGMLDPELTATYHDSFHKLWEAGIAVGADGVLSTHGWMHGAIEKLQTMTRVEPGGPNPFLLGAESYGRFMRAQDHCVMANLMRHSLEGR